MYKILLVVVLLQSSFFFFFNKLSNFGQKQNLCKNFNSVYSSMVHLDTMYMETAGNFAKKVVFK